MFLVVIAAYVGGLAALVALWSHGWLIALAAAPFAGSGAALIVTLLLMFVGKGGALTRQSPVSADTISAY
jgi:hypothetical protein